MKRVMGPRKKEGSATDCMIDTRKNVCKIKLRARREVITIIILIMGNLPHLELKGYSGVRYQ